MQKKRIAIFASGNGSNALNLIQHFAASTKAEIAFVLTNRSDAGVLVKAKNAGIPTFILSNEEIESGNSVVEICQNESVDLIVLAGFLRKIPHQLIAKYPNSIVNIHPALLPKYGGKGMYGDHVHRAVIESGEKESGISIHLVNEQFDEGELVAQFKCQVADTDSVESLRQRVQNLEHAHYAEVVQELIEKK